MKNIDSTRTQPSPLRRLLDGFNLMCAALELSELELMQLRVARLTKEVADLRRTPGHRMQPDS